MNILYLCHRIPYPPNKGDKIRSYHQVKYLSQYHTLYLACLIDDPDDWQHVEPLRSMCRHVEVVERKCLSGWWRVGKALLFGYPLSVGAFVVPELQRKVDQLLQLEAIDRIVIFSSPMAEYVKHIHTIPKIVDFVDMDSEKWRAYASVKSFPLSQLYTMEADRLGDYEWEVAQACTKSIVISEEETPLLKKRSDHTIIPKVIANGVDYDYFSLTSKVERAKPIIVFTAAMDYFPNVDAAEFFCRTILPRIHQVVPQAQFFIVGRNPVPSLRQLEERIPNVHVTGTVPDVRPYLSEAIVAVAPLRIARGVQNKILEAMAMELPVVGTTPAFQGLPVSSDYGMYLANEPEEFANAVVKLLTNPDRARRDGRVARQFVMSRYDWSVILKEFEQVL